jgi:hypothetical protein
VKKFHVLVKAVVNVLVDIEAENHRDAACQAANPNIVEHAVYKNNDFGSQPEGVKVTEVSLDEGAEKEVEVTIYNRQGHVQFENARVYVDGPNRPVAFRENFKTAVSRVRIIEDSHTREVVELHDPQEQK